MCVFHVYEKRHFGQVSTRIEENAAKLGSSWPTDLRSQLFFQFLDLRDSIKAPDLPGGRQKNWLAFLVVAVYILLADSPR